MKLTQRNEYRLVVVWPIRLGKMVVLYGISLQIGMVMGSHLPWGTSPVKLAQAPRAITLKNVTKLYAYIFASVL